MPVVLYNQSLPAGASADVTVKYYLGPGSSTNASPTLVAIATSPVGTATAAGLQVHISRAMLLQDGTFLLNFNTVANGSYQVQFTSDLRSWKASSGPLVQGTGYPAQWLDYGPPASDSFPRSTPVRLYRVIQISP
jgi:hypothetical protein